MLDLAIVLTFIIYALAAGLRARRAASRGLEDYFLAGRTLRGWQAGTSMAATQFAADTPLLVAGLVATGGVFLLWRLWIYGLAFLLMAYVFSRLWRRSRVLTDAELTEIRYSGRGVLFLRVLKAVYYGTVINCVVLAMVLVAAMRIAEVFLPWHLWLPDPLYSPVLEWVSWTGVELDSGVTDVPSDQATTNNVISILAIVAFTGLYSLTGGLRGVVATDVGQFALAMLGTVGYAYFVIREVGGLGALSDRVVSQYGREAAGDLLAVIPPGQELLGGFLVILSLQWIFQMNSDGTGYLAQRSMACRTHQDAREAGVVFAWLQIFARSLLWLVIAVGLLVIYPFGAQEATSPDFAAQREVLFVTGIDDLLPVGIRGLMLTGLLAALASTIDTHLNWGASYWTKDLYQRLVCQHWLRREPGRRELVAVARASNVVILALGLLVMAHLGAIQTAWFLSLLFGAGMGSVLVLRWLWERINLHSEIAAIVASIVTAPVLLWATEEEWIRLGVMAVVSTVAAVAAAFLAPETRADVRIRFYRRVRPAGLWTRTAEEAGLDRRHPVRVLARDLGTTVLAGLSLFFLLAGTGRILVPGPGDQPLISWGLVLGGAALIPLWWSRTFLGSKVTSPGERAPPSRSFEGE